MTAGGSYSMLPLNVFFDDQLNSHIRDDDVDKFVSVIQRELDSYANRGQVILDRVCELGSVKCAEALITGQTPLTVDVNLPCCPHTGMNPLHVVASMDSPLLHYPLPAMTELLLYYGARTDIRYNKEEHVLYPVHPTLSWKNADTWQRLYEEKMSECANKLPLQMAFRSILPRHYPSGWTPEQSIYKLIAILCLPRLQNKLESVALLAGTTKETGEVFFEYAVEGKIIELAALLMVAPKEKLNDVMDRLLQHLGSDITSLPFEEGRKEKLACVQQLLEVFDRAGDVISSLVKGNRFRSDRRNTRERVRGLLRKAGFSVLDSEVDFTDDKMCYKDHGDGLIILNEAPFEKKRCLIDFGMAHYSKSGYRWKVSSNDDWLRHSNHEAYVNELEKRIESLKAEKVSIEKQQQQLNLRVCMDDELWSVLERDDREEFVSLIADRVDFFGPRQQQVLYAVCSSGSIKCAEALIKGITPLSVDLNCPCTDTGLYPLHCAALSLFPSITELLLHHGARNGIVFRPHNPSAVFPQQLIEEHTNKLPLHMALNVIARLPCIREWTSRHSVHNLVTLLCLPRMQDSLETLELLAMTTEEIEKEFFQLAMDGKLVEVAALLTVAYTDLRHDMLNALDQYKFVESCLLDDDEKETRRSALQLFKLFDVLGNAISVYIKEDKYNVSKYQVIEDVSWMIKSKFLPELVDIDLSVYDWYRIEERSCLAQEVASSCEHVRRSNDIGMEHYSKSSFRWRGSRVMLKWRLMKNQEYINKMEVKKGLLWEENDKAKHCLEKDMRPAAYGIPYILRHGVPIASSSFFSHSALDAHKLEIRSQEVHIFQNNSPSRTMSSLTSSFSVWTSQSRMTPSRAMLSMQNSQSRAMSSTASLYGLRKLTSIMTPSRAISFDLWNIYRRVTPSRSMSLAQPMVGLSVVSIRELVSTKLFFKLIVKGV